MEGFVKGDVIVLEFPFSDLSAYKRRPALIIKVPKGEDIIICQITAKSQEESVEILLKNEDFNKGKLKRESFVRIDKIATIKKSRIKYKIGSLKENRFNFILERVCDFLKN